MTTSDPAPNPLGAGGEPDDRPEPLPLRTALPRLGRCAGRTASLLAHRRLHLPIGNKGRTMTFADGTSAVVYRETVADRDEPAEPVILVVAFRLRGVRGRGHALFRAESMLNTPLFAGFPGFVSKLWLTADEAGRYRGFYQWDGADSARDYVRALWWPLALVSEHASIRNRVLPGLWRDHVLAAAGRDRTSDTDAGEWWRLSSIS
ncbi:YdhR family protein [Rhodococcus sp. HM1]|uniref:YdhR family protein n=1 Tax=Rhodococcus sp. HM1 TaxID=2937759 RepID=UPI00200A8A13|nr:YdhR family protein [Rhodococcus sp. HM1]MCK8671990.1 YdhR family protein [Rhodococcus sp. HM1]